MDEPRIIVALDFPSERQALDLVARLEPRRCRLKIGKELFTRAGPSLVERLVGQGFDVFLDLKFHDIPNTTARACAAAAELGVWMLNVHALGGRAMLTAAREAVEAASSRPLLLAVTVLTSLQADALHEVGLAGSVPDNVVRLAGLAQDCGLDGVVCSAQEAADLRARCGEDFTLVTPGIRPAGSAAGDQRRVVTPAEAVRLGAHYLVIGRPITAAAEPLQAIEAVERELAGAV